MNAARIRARLVVVAALASACAAGKTHTEIDAGGALIREGMTEAEVTKALGPPEFVSGSEHRFAREFRGATIEPAWQEWAWFAETRTYVAYLANGVVRRVGVIESSPTCPT